MVSGDKIRYLYKFYHDLECCSVTADFYKNDHEC